jgi:uncharacterized membrane protein YfcA
MSFIIGFLAGMFGGMFGVGGGVVMIPLMVRGMHMGQLHAHGTSLAALVFIGIAGAITYGLKGSVDILSSVLLAATAIGTASAGARYAHALPEWKLKRAFGIFLFFVANALFLKTYIPQFQFLVSGWLKVMVLLIAGVLTGFLSGMMGVGGGSIMVPAMVILVGLDQHTAQGSSLLTMVPTGVAGALTHFRLGNVRTNLLTGLIVGVFIGTYLGSQIAHFMQDSTLRAVFAAMLIWTSLRYIRATRQS